jgi:uncharacterized membrane protein
MKRMYILLLTVVLGATVACKSDNEQDLYGANNIDCGTINASFSNNVASIIQTKCAISGCHNAAGASGGRVLENYTQIKAAADRIRQRAVVEKTMPKTGSLTAYEIALLKCWIDSGAPNN